MKIAFLTAICCLVLSAAGVSAASDQAGQCPDYNDPGNTLIETNDGSVVLDAGTVFCIHASNNNTGVLVADGTTTLDEYIAANILNNGGQVPGISNYVIYSTRATPTPTATPTETPTPTPTDNPTPTPTVTPTETPSPTPTETPSTNPTPTPTETDVVPPPDNSVTPPPTDAAPVVYSPTTNVAIVLGALLLLGTMIGVLTPRTRR